MLTSFPIEGRFTNDPRENRTLCLYFYEMIISLVITGVYEALKEVKRLCKEFGFTAGMLKGSLEKGRGEK